MVMMRKYTMAPFGWGNGYVKTTQRKKLAPGKRWKTRLGELRLSQIAIYLDVNYAVLLKKIAEGRDAGFDPDIAVNWAIEQFKGNPK